MPLKDPEKRKAYQLQYHKKWYAENRTEKLAQNAQYRLENWESEKARIRFKRQNSREQWEKEYARTRKWLAKHPDYARNKMRQYRLRIIEHFGARCAQCGFADERALQIDHIDGAGTAMRKFFKNQQAAYYTAIWRQIQKGSDQYQVLCANCNTIKRSERREYDGFPDPVENPTLPLPFLVKADA